MRRTSRHAPMRRRVNERLCRVYIERTESRHRPVRSLGLTRRALPTWIRLARARLRRAHLGTRWSARRQGPAPRARPAPARKLTGPRGPWRRR
eukprot:scaffold21857_cov112-Isochrysis_galbana.AAC.2